MENVHTLLMSVRDNTITPDDVMRHIIPEYEPDLEYVPTLRQIEEFIEDSLNESGMYPEQYDNNFMLCISCNKLRLWDPEMNEFLHIEPSECIEAKDVENALKHVRSGAR